MDTLTAPLQEQSVCIHCGFCCDGTLFMMPIWMRESAATCPGRLRRLHSPNPGKTTSGYLAVILQAGVPFMTSNVLMYAVHTVASC
ncbi:MAG: hypothetical protein IH591_11590 [Bacteroidales bacterium]|nr:hypothetical protein [Bacteroidales bacterium]